MLMIISIVIVCAALLTYCDGYDILNTLNTYIEPRRKKEYHDTNNLQWARYLRARWMIIHSEFDLYRSKIPRYRDIDSVQTPVDNDVQHWNVLMLRLYGKNTIHAKKFPKTMKYINNIKVNIPTVFFSILEPGKTIPPHVGPWNGILKYHLALDIPIEGEVYLDVNGIKKEWKQGKDILFDDTFTHSAYNISNKSRVILLLEVERKLDGFLQSMINKIVLTAAKYNETTNKIVSKVK